MNKKQTLKILAILAVVSMLLVLGTTLARFLQTSRERGNYQILFGRLNPPIQINITSGLNTNLETELSGIETSNKVFMIDTENDLYPSKALTENIAKRLNLEFMSGNDDTSLYVNIENGTSLEFTNTTKTIHFSFYPPGALDQNQPLDKKKSEIIAKAKLMELHLWPFTADSEYSTSYTYYLAIGNSYYEANSKDTASLISVNFRSQLEGLPSIMSKTDSGEIEVLLDSSCQVLKISYMYRPVKQDTVGIYPVKSATAAFEQIQQKKAEISIPFEGEPASLVNIQKVTSAYRVEQGSQKYLQPVYIFEGTDNHNQTISIIVPALDHTYLTQ